MKVEMGQKIEWTPARLSAAALAGPGKCHQIDK
jgi:hypothetical protein